tara:strand:- start:2549 stop:3580 length:1032 start_codon:yes stop_codon:yes gene_type:complete
MGAKEVITKFLEARPDGVSTSDISERTKHTRATAAKYLELMKLEGLVDFREVGKAKLWFLTQNKKKKILIVEDEANIMRLIEVILSSGNYSFVKAMDGEEALEKVSQEMPDLIILDVMMPKIDGIEVCKQLKTNILTKRIPIIMLTAKGEMTDKFEGIATGADDYLTKPFDPRELKVRVKTFLEKEQKERNPVTNLPTFHTIEKELKNLGKGFGVLHLHFTNFDEYKKNYGYSRYDEMLRLISQMITHNLGKISEKNFVAHCDVNSFLIIIESKNIDHFSKILQDEFKSTIPFFYDLDYENLDLKKNVLVKTNGKGEKEKIPLIKINFKKISKDDALEMEKEV